MTLGEKITKTSGSNFALAFLTLSPQKRRDLSTFYAFCRIIDDIADDFPTPVDDRQNLLTLWRRAVVEETPGEHLLAPDLRDILGRYPIDRRLLGDIISGMEMDLRGERYETLADLQLYCYRVAGAVGLVSIEIFGYRNSSAREHAKFLGEALQITNILRDVAEDYRGRGRIYLPLEEMCHSGYSEQDLQQERYNPQFTALMNAVAAVAKKNYALAESAVAPEDRLPLRPGLIMGDIYHKLLEKMEQKKYRVFSERFRLSKLQKLVCVLRRTLVTP